MPPRRYEEEEEFSIDPVEVERDFRATLERWGIEPSGDGRVHEHVAARLLTYSALYLRNMRQEGKAPRALKVAGRVCYRLRDLAKWIAENTELA